MVNEKTELLNNRLFKIEHENSVKLLVFSLEKNRFALPLSKVSRVIRSVEITFVPGLADIALGIINLEGEITPVLSIRKRFNFLNKEIGLNDHFIVAFLKNKKVILPVDSVLDIIELKSDEIIQTAKIFKNSKYIKGVVKVQDGLILIYDLESFLSANEEKKLNEAVKKVYLQDKWKP